MLGERRGRHSHNVTAPQEPKAPSVSQARAKRMHHKSRAELDHPYVLVLVDPSDHEAHDIRVVQAHDRGL
jgi:hypothetical protein